MRCPACRADVPSGARFCPACGQDLTLRGDERRVVTVLFADLVGFTGLSEARDPEQVKNIVDRCFEHVVRDIEAFGGRVDKIIGDAVVALFGAPVAHEDDAERAVRAGLRILQTLDRTAADLGVEVRMRVGVNTGEVLVGALRAGGDYTAMGDVVNTANRLQAAAEPGQVVVGPATHAATHRVIRYRSLGEVTARGRAAVPAWVAEAAVLPPGHRPDRHRAPLVGRDPEVAVLEGAVAASVTHGRASLLLVLGEAGVGKSRLVEELASSVQDRHGALVLEGRCVPYGEANVWWPVAEALRQGCEIRSDDTEERARALATDAVRTALGEGAPDADVARVLAGLLYLMGYDSPLRGIDQTRARDEATSALVTFAERYAQRRPVVVALSDLHWADDLVLEVVDTLLTRLCDRPLIVLATARRTLEERWSTPHGRHNLVSLTLDPLPGAAAADLLASLSGNELSPELAEELLERSGGNPLFLEELVALLAEAGAATEGGQIAAPARELPDTLRGLVAARLDGLGTEERRVLDDCAVLGRRGPVVAIEVMAAEHLGIDDVRPALDVLVDKELIELRGLGNRERWSFRSDLVREVAYGMLTKADRAKSHAGIAAWMEGNEPLDQEAVVDRIAHHYGRAAALVAELGSVAGVPADVTDRALTWLERAAGRAAESEVALVAARLYREGLQLIGDEAGPRRRVFQLGRARALASLRQLAEAAGLAEAALAEARDHGDDDGVADALVVLADVAQKDARYEHADAMLEEAQQRYRRLGDASGEAGALRLRGFGALFRHDYARATELLEVAHDRYEELGDDRGTAWALQNLAWCAFYSGRPDEAEERLRTAADMFASHGDRGGLGWALGLLAYTRFMKGYRAEADEMAADVLERATELGDRWGSGMMLLLQAAVRLWSGRISAAVERSSEALAVFDDIGDAFGRFQAQSSLGRALVSAGRVDEGLARLQGALQESEPPPDDRGRAFHGVALAGAANALGDVTLAATWLDRVRESAGSDGSALGEELAATTALHLLQRGDPETALQLVQSVCGSQFGLRGGNAPAVAALVLASLHDAAGAEAAADAVDGDERSTHYDQVLAGTARVLARARAGDTAGAGRALAAVAELADATDDLVAQAVVRLAADAVGRRGSVPGAGDLGADAETRLRSLGADATGWRRVLALALGTEAESGGAMVSPAAS